MFVLQPNSRLIFKLIIFTVAQNKGAKPVSLEEALTVLMSGFLRGGVGFLKNTGEMIKGSSGLNREVRVGVTHVSKISTHKLTSFIYFCHNFITQSYKNRLFVDILV